MLGAVVRLLASHQCDFGLVSYVSWVCCGFLFCSEVFSLGSPVLLPPQKPTSPHSYLTRLQNLHGKPAKADMDYSLHIVNSFTYCWLLVSGLSIWLIMLIVLIVLLLLELLLLLLMLVSLPCRQVLLVLLVLLHVLLVCGISSAVCCGYISWVALRSTTINTTFCVRTKQQWILQLSHYSNPK